MNIDFILPWVNPKDPEWIKQKAKYNGEIVDVISNSESRYRDMDTLRFVLRSIEKNCPWYNKIYLVTSGHYPEWLDINNDKIELVVHEDMYFDISHLPVFSASSIEMNIGNIGSLSETFVYLNDDTLIMQPTEISRFFKNGLPVDFLCHGWLPRNRLFKLFRTTDAWTDSLNNNLKLINQQLDLNLLSSTQLFNSSYSIKNKFSNFLLKNIYKKFLWIEHWHHPQPYLKKTLQEVREHFFENMMICSANKFRKENDLTQYLYRYWHLSHGEFVPEKHNDSFVDNIYSLNQLERILEEKKDIRFLCLNDAPELDVKEFDSVKLCLTSYLEKVFPNKASFEI
ncbi:MAG: Stealth CR1 domain-containing protein [[Actinobacillus] rossii]|nr:Stealth CR1 domain-containing protein [[Actinobacillus] rossii]MDY5792913.1 Stealth CR1 domain-containing protein [[Actinobacillus] rossii]